jgi:ABC-2 type transport system ATP-binding protein
MSRMDALLPAIRVDALARRFGDLEAVAGISLDVGRGELFALLGPNGAGKTTTVRMLTTLLTPSAGRAAIDGIDVCTAPREVRRRIGVVFQEASLDDRLTARENMALHARLYHLPRTERPARIDAALALVGLSERADDFVKTFSGGMRRRLEIARGLLHEPAVLFLDEPTVGLDPQTRRAIWDHLVMLKRERGTTILVTTHYMDEAERCDRVAIIDHGRLVALDTPAALKKRIGGDVVTARLSEGLEAKAALDAARTLGVEGAPLEDGEGHVRFEVEDGEAFVPRLVTALGGCVAGVAVRRPTLDDVFLKLTGHVIRDGSADASGSPWAAFKRRRA